MTPGDCGAPSVHDDEVARDIAALLAHRTEGIVWVNLYSAAGSVLSSTPVTVWVDDLGRVWVDSGTATYLVGQTFDHPFGPQPD